LVVVLTMAQSGHHAAHAVNNKVNIFLKCFFLQPTTTPAVIGDSSLCQQQTPRFWGQP